MADPKLDPSSSNPLVVNGVDTADVPSAAWGWSGESFRTYRVAGWASFAFLLLMLIGNHEGHVETLWLIGFALLLLLFLVRDMLVNRKEQ
ncbi:MAG: DUF2631 domain-containing protein [Rhodococcus sp.]|nr:DUF2631 domain-containing protein [Rhodococcus sp. (in: high G+C Gram-positive bacteria)]